jgi:putative ABC transport system permease protein
MHSDPNQSLAGGRVPLVERVFGRLMPRSFTFRLPLRNVFRARRRSLYTVLGIAFAMVLSVVTISMFDSIDALLFGTFERVERWDIVAVFDQPVGPSRVAEVRAIRGVERVQPALVLPVKVLHQNNQANVSLTAMDPDADFHGFTTGHGQTPAQALAAGEIVLSTSTAEKLGVGVGQRVNVDPPPDGDPVSLRVGSLSDETLGQPGFVSLETAADITDSPQNRYNALYLTSDPAKANRIQDELYDMPGAASVQVKAGLIERLKSLMAVTNVFGWVLLAFGSALAFVVVFTTFTANVAERTREIATMRTIGEDNLRLTIMVTLENLLLTVAALPLGVWLGIKATDAIFASFETESYTLTASIYPASVARICALMIVVVLLSEIPPVRRIFRLDLAEATKVME